MTSAAHYLNEERILLFLVQLVLLLGCAKVVGSLFHRKGYPALAGEILTGVLLGPTVFGRLMPGAFAALFPNDVAQQNMLETVSWLGVLFLLLATGFEVSISSVWKQGRAALTIGFIGVFVPFAIETLCTRVAATQKSLDRSRLIDAVRRREDMMGTGLEHGLAVPHGRVPDLQSPVIAFGRSAAGIDWNARDGKLSHFVFLIVTPEREEGVQVQILAAIARAITNHDLQQAVGAADTAEDIYNLLKPSLSKGPVAPEAA